MLMVLLLLNIQINIQRYVHWKIPTNKSLQLHVGYGDMLCSLQQITSSSTVKLDVMLKEGL